MIGGRGLGAGFVGGVVMCCLTMMPCMNTYVLRPVAAKISISIEFRQKLLEYHNRADAEEGWRVWLELDKIFHRERAIHKIDKEA